MSAKIALKSFCVNKVNVKSVYYDELCKMGNVKWEMKANKNGGKWEEKVTTDLDQQKSCRTTKC